MIEYMEKVVYSEPYGYIYVTDVCPRFEDKILSGVDICERYSEMLIEIIPLYREVE